MLNVNRVGNKKKKKKIGWMYKRNGAVLTRRMENIEIKGSFGMCGPSVLNIFFLCTIKFWNCNGNSLFNDSNENAHIFFLEKGKKNISIAVDA